jgi:hypothetical protein
MRREKIQISKIKNEVEITINTKEIRESPGTTLKIYIQIK